MDTSDYRNRRYRTSFFFPIALITVGVVWLLVNNGMIPVENVWRLFPLWPVLLILGGISLILHRLWWPLPGLLWAVTAIGVVGMLLNPPAFLPQTPTAQLRQQTFREPLGSAKSATVNLDFSVYSNEVSALKNSTDLIVADLNYLGAIKFKASGTDQKTVTLDEEFNVGFFRWDLFINQKFEPWKIGLNPTIPLRLRVNGGTGSTNLDLSGLKLETLKIDGGTGSLRVTLPEGNPSFPFTLDGGTGSVTIAMAKGTAVDLNVEGGTGSLNIHLPEGAGVRVDVRSGGTGSLNLPEDFQKVSSGSGRKEGVYENSAYATSKNQVNIILDIGTGSVNLR